MAEKEEIARALGEMGQDSAVLTKSNIAHLVATGHTWLSLREVPGVHLQAKRTSDGIAAELTVSEGARIENPVHLCVGVLEKRGDQRINIAIHLEARSAATFMAHCFFPSAEKVLHAMDAVVDLGREAELRFLEGHYHGPFGGASVLPKADVHVGPRARYVSDFSLTTGRVGQLYIDYNVEAEEEALAEMTTRIFGHATDDIRIRERVALAGKRSRSLIKIRVAVEDQASADVSGITEGREEGARGHVDCVEIVKDQAVANAVPIVKVTHPLAKVTHEAAIGSVDKKQLETLMAHGLTPAQAVDMVVTGMLR
ncbi:MAG: SufD family Fe-S cluster assembly protein [Deltaproteobacteria bacterium]|nr:SufD family Fe-S cluster assembly protein [Deltaproteobacteria bacterium]